MNYIAKIRQQKPLIHNITNTVVANFTANGLLALGASPAMANEPEEAAEMAAHADALVLNIGTFTKVQLNAMMLAGKSANEQGIPVILDPVAVGATTFRKRAVDQILSEIDVAVIRGNAGEIALIGDLAVDSKGTETMLDEIDAKIAGDVSDKYDAVVVASGETDLITKGYDYVLCKNGVPMLPNVTGTGCLLTSVIAAFLSVSDDPFDACIQAVSSYGVAAERAMEASSGPGTFLPAFLDELYQLTERQVKAQSKLIQGEEIR